MAAQKGVLPDNLYLNLLVDGREFHFATTITLKHEVNSARTIHCQFTGREGLEGCRLGAKVELSWHKNSPASLLFDDARSFIGVIKTISPGENQSSFMAFDYITHLAESQFTYYKLEDYIGEDLYFAAARACDYKGIDVTRLTSGSGIFITKNMNLFGWKTRKEFIDLCFNEMKVLVDDGQHPRNTIKQWYYAIRKDNIMDFFLPDPKMEGAFPSLTVSENNNNIAGGGLVSQIDTSQMINAITVASKTDETLYAQIEDGASIDVHGIASYFLQYGSTNEAELYNVGYEVLNRYNKPSIYYNVTTQATDDISLGDLVKVKVPSIHAALYASSDILTLVGYEMSISETISTRLKLGEKPLTISQMIDIMKAPVDR
jgi:hypothetical protein